MTADSALLLFLLGGYGTFAVLGVRTLVRGLRRDGRLFPPRNRDLPPG